MTEPARHIPVALERCRELLAPALSADGAVFVDCTLGMGGHTEAILAACPRARAIGIDRDADALEFARQRLAPFADRVVFVHARYDQIADALTAGGASRAQAVLFDLGVSSYQLDTPERGFSYAREAPLDMRMDASTGPTAADVLATYSERDLVRVLRRYGEEPGAKRIAAAIVAARGAEPISTTDRLVALNRAALPAPAMRTGGNPAKRTFQALRIEVNDELGVLRSALGSALDALAVGGRIATLAYHSLEDRECKRAFVAGASSNAPPDLPIEPESSKPELRLLTRGAERPTEDEIRANPRSAPARLRAAERIRERRDAR